MIIKPRIVPDRGGWYCSHPDYWVFGQGETPRAAYAEWSKRWFNFYGRKS